jgi:hypothetical protein
VRKIAPCDGSRRQTPTFYPCPDAYVIKLDPSGAVIYATYLGGSGADAATAIAVDSNGNAYIAGTTTPANSSTPNNFPVTSGAAFTKPSADGADDFVAKLNATGDKLIYSTFIPELSGAALAIDAQGRPTSPGLRFRLAQAWVQRVFQPRPVPLKLLRQRWEAPAESPN